MHETKRKKFQKDIIRTLLGALTMQHSLNDSRSGRERCTYWKRGCFERKARKLCCWVPVNIGSIEFSIYNVCARHSVTAYCNLNYSKQNKIHARIHNAYNCISGFKISANWDSKTRKTFVRHCVTFMIGLCALGSSARIHTKT